MRQNEMNYVEQCLHSWHVIEVCEVKGKPQKTFQCDHCRERFVSTIIESNPAFGKLFPKVRIP